MKLTERAILELMQHEAVVLEAYKDSVGVWTWSVGITKSSGHNVKRYIGKPQTLERCLEVFLWVLERYVEEVREEFRGYELTEAQFAAAVSFHYNTGGIKQAKWVDKWKAGDVAGAKRAIMAWRKPPEIIGRRKKERDLFFNEKWTNTGKTLVYRSVRNTKPASPKSMDIREALRKAMKPHDGATAGDVITSGGAVVAIEGLFTGNHTHLLIAGAIILLGLFVAWRIRKNRG